MNAELDARSHRQRVLTLLDASRQSIAALGAAVELASRGRSELLALYVEDQDLISCASFPFFREVGGRSGLVRPLSLTEVQASLRHQQQRASEALRRAVAGRDIPHSLRVSRGRVLNETLSLAGPGDLLVLGKAGLSGQWGVRLGSTSRALLLQAPCTVVIWDERQPLVRGPLRLYGEAQAVSRFAPLFDSVEHLPGVAAPVLERQLLRARGGALLLRREDLRQLMKEDPELLARVPVPVMVSDASAGAHREAS